MKNLYIIVTSWRCLTPEIYTTYQPYKAVKYMSERMEWDESPSPDDDPEELLDNYNDWIKRFNDDQCETTIALKVEEI